MREKILLAGFSFVAAFMTLIFSVLGLAPLLFLYNSTTYTDMEVVAVKTDLPLVFLDSHRQGDELIYYQFDLQPKTSLKLIGVVISDENESKSFKYFEAEYDTVDFLGKPLNYSVDLLQESFDKFSKESIRLDSKVSLMTTNTLEGHRWKEEFPTYNNFFEENDLNVLFVFEEGTASVHYKFFDKEEMYPPHILYELIES